jgi:pimeloyl-ACP methyl ester carboxylesterase
MRRSFCLPLPFLILPWRSPPTRVEIFEGAGHALFVDDADRFNTVRRRHELDLSNGGKSRIR